MKIYQRIALATILLACTHRSTAQKINAKKVPEIVKYAYQIKFPTGQNPKWEKDNGNFEVNFVWNATPFSSVFDPKGNWMETETVIAKKILPPAVKATLRRDFKDYTIIKAEEADFKGKGIIFETILKYGKHQKEVHFAQNGKVLPIKD